MINCPIFNPATGQAGEPQDYAGNHGVKNGAAAKWKQRMDVVPSGLFRQEGVIKNRAPDHAEDHGANTDRNNVSERGGKLGAYDSLQIGDQFIAARGVARVMDDASQRSASHGRLLGGQGEMEVLHQDKADSIIQTGQETFDEGRQAAVGDEQLDSRGANSENAATERGAPHLRILFAVGRDVMLTCFPSPFDNLFSQQAKAIVKQINEAAVFQASANDVTQQARGGDFLRRPRLSHQNASDNLHAQQAFFDDIECVDDIKVDTARIEMGHDAF